MTLTVQGLLLAEPDVATQLALLCVWAGFWFAVLDPFARRVVKPYVLSRPWREQWGRLTRRYARTAFFIEFRTSEEALDLACLFVAIIGQHALGGALCLPSLLGARGRVATALACHGALCEAGWELQDALEMARAVALGGAEGRSRNPAALLVVLALHHSMGLRMVLPMNVTYPDSLLYHEAIFLLQGAAFFAMAAQLYGFTLDVSTKSGLRQMQACAGCTMLVLLWTRVLRFAYLGHSLASVFFADGNSRLALGGCVVLCTMGIFNLLLTVDAVAKFRKFANMSVPADRCAAPAGSKRVGCETSTAGHRRARLPSLLVLSSPAKQHQK